MASTHDELTLHFLPGYAPQLNPDELVWSHAKRTGHARRTLPLEGKACAMHQSVPRRHRPQYRIGARALQTPMCSQNY